MSSKLFNIAGRLVGPGQPCFVIAEAGVNHNGNLETARQMIDAAAQAGADAVKFQTFKADKLATQDAPKADYQVEATGSAESQFEMLRRLELSADAHVDLMKHCRERNVLFLSTPFDEASADFLAELGVAAFKIPSGEITNLPLLAHVGQLGKPLIVSTGMSSLGEVETALNTINRAGNEEVALLHCVSNYPADPADVNLRAMLTMATAFGVPVGYSDHTLGTAVPLAAVALGACIIEKHFTMSRILPGPDQQASLESAGLYAMIHSIHIIESALGNGRKEPAASEANTAEIARRSLVAASAIPAGAVLTEDKIAIKRPGTGLPPAMRPYLVGRKARVDIPAEVLITLDMLA